MEHEEQEELSLIVRRKKVAPESHGVAAWKIAYADFVTAMMAFFLLLWLLNASMTVDMAMVGNSFVESDKPKEISATGNLFDAGGSNNEKVDGEVQNQQVVDNVFTIDEPAQKVTVENRPEEERLTTQEEILQGETTKNDGEFSLEDLEQELLKALKQIYSENPSEAVNTQVFMDRVGLNIEFMSEEGQRTFRRNSAEMTRPLRNTLFVISRFLSRLDRQIMITGHTAMEGTVAKQWRLSMARADVTRQVLTRMGIPESRIFGIGGKASTSPIDNADPFSDKNIRVQITLLAQDDRHVLWRDVRGSPPPEVSQ